MSEALPLVLVPGLLCSARLYSEQIGALWRFGPVTVADHTRDDTMAAIARRILDLAPPRFALAGLSLGGYIALTMVREAPERVEKLALLDTSARPETPEQTVRRLRQIALAQSGQFAEVPALQWPLLVHRNRHGDEALRRVVRNMAEETGADAFVRQQTAIMARADVRPLLASITCPTLVLVGDGDELTPPWLAEEIAGGIEGARLVVVPDCGHLSTMERPDAVNEALIEWMANQVASVLDLIGETPLVEVTRIERGPCRLFLKLESTNPSGSIKDRPARAMIEAAEADGRLKPGGTIVEATAGNTGLGLALVGGRKGHRTLLVVPDKMAREKVLHAKAMGAEVVITRSDVGKGHADYYQDLAAAIAARTAGAFYVDQFGNPANPRAHETTTGPEILRQMAGAVDAVVVGVGSGGTLTGIGRFMRASSPQTAMVLADPEGSILAPYVQTGRSQPAGSWAVEGIGEDFVPPNADLTLVSTAYSISDAESFALARELLRAEGILAGSSSGTLLAAALRYCREQSEPKRVVSLVCDSGAKYLSKVFNPTFLAQEGFLHPDRHGTVRDVVTHRYSEGTAVVVRPQDNLRTVFARMRSSEVSQLPVVDERGHVVGLVDESDVLAALLTDPEGPNSTFARPVKDVMTTRLETISADAPVADLVPLFRKDYIAIVMDGDQFLGVATRLDLINHFRLAP